MKDKETEATMMSSFAQSHTDSRKHKSQDVTQDTPIYHEKNSLAKYLPNWQGI